MPAAFIAPRGETTALLKASALVYSSSVQTAIACRSMFSQTLPRVRKYFTTHDSSLDTALQTQSLIQHCSLC